MPDPASIPWGTVKVRHKLGNIRNSECNVYVDGQPVAKLAVTELRWEWEANTQQLALLRLALLAERMDTESMTPGQRPKDPEEGQLDG